MNLAMSTVCIGQFSAGEFPITGKNTGKTCASGGQKSTLLRKNPHSEPVSRHQTSLKPKSEQGINTAVSGNKQGRIREKIQATGIRIRIPPLAASMLASEGSRIVERSRAAGRQFRRAPSSAHHAMVRPPLRSTLRPRLDRVFAGYRPLYCGLSQIAVAN